MEDEARDTRGGHRAEAVKGDSVLLHKLVYLRFLEEGERVGSQLARGEKMA